MAGISSDVRKKSIQKLQDCERKISSGAQAFLIYEYKIISVFCIIFAVIVWYAVDEGGKPFACIAYVIGSITSLVCGYLSMLIATYANVRTTFLAMTTSDKDDSKYNDAFKMAFRAGSVMGYIITSGGLFVLLCLFLAYQKIYGGA